MEKHYSKERTPLNNTRAQTLSKKKIYKLKQESNATQKSKFPKLEIKCVKLIANPKKNLGIRFVYRMPADILINDDFPNNEVIDILGNFRKFKKIVSVAHEKNKKIFFCQVVNNYEFSPPYQLLIYRLQSLGNINAYNLSKTVENVIEMSKNKNKIEECCTVEQICQRPSYKNFLKENERILKEYSENYPIIIWRESNFDNISNENIYQVGFNHQFLNLIGEEMKNFGMKLLKKGVPECLYVENNYFQLADYTLKNVFFQNFPKEKGENIELSFIIKNKKLRSQRIGVLNKFEEDHFSERLFIETFRVDQKKLESLILNSKTQQENDNHEPIINTPDQEMNVFLENDSSKENKINIIRKFYPNLKINFVEQYEDQLNLRCVFRKLD